MATDSETRPSVTLALIFVAGAAGTLLRWGVSLLVPTAPWGWPWATFVVNILGAFVLGALASAIAARGPVVGVRKSLRLTLGTGLLGGFTTYSAFAVETGQLLGSRPVIGVGYGVVTLAGGLAAAGVGLWVGPRIGRQRGTTR